jgi:hypothetical protein
LRDIAKDGLMRINYAFCVFLFLAIMLPMSASRSEIVAVSYIRNYIQSNWNVNLPAPTGTIASTKYLFSAIDATNQSLNGVATSYSSGASATGGIVGKTLADKELTSGKIKYCAPGTYLAAGNNDCQNCGAGYYCTGGSNRQECTYGTGGCPELNHTYDELPKFEVSLMVYDFRCEYSGKDISIYLSAQGNFTIDWGDGSAVENITRTDTTLTDYSHKYTANGVYTVTLRGRATGYSSDEYTAAVRFSAQDNTHASLIKTLKGDLGAIFPILNSSDTGSPRFIETFTNSIELTSIPENLFAGLQGPPVSRMFYGTFHYCTSLTSIPAGLFAGISGPPAEHMFNSTFYGCMGLTSIPENLFGNLSGPPAPYMFAYTFTGCMGLTGPSAKIGGQYLYELFPTATTYHTRSCYYRASGLDDYDSMPDAWKNYQAFSPPMPPIPC